MTSPLNLLLWQFFLYFNLYPWQFQDNFELLNRTQSSSLKLWRRWRALLPQDGAAWCPGSLSRVGQSLGNKPHGQPNPASLSLFYECQAHLIIHIKQRPHDALSFQQWVKRKLTMSACERQWEKTWQPHLMSRSHLTEGVLMLSLHSCLKIKEGLDGKQPGIAFQNQLPGNFLHKTPFKMIYANSTSRLKMLHRDRAVCFAPIPSLNASSVCIDAFFSSPRNMSQTQLGW